MLSKEEIEKAKENIVNIIDKSFDKFMIEESKETLQQILDKQLYIDSTPENTKINAYEAIKTLLKYIEQLESQIKAKEMEHKYDVNMIDEVKGESVNLYKEIRQLEQEIKALKKGQTSLMSSRKKWKGRYYKLRKMLNKQNKTIDEMAKSIYLEMPIEFYNEKAIKEQTITGIKQYFEKKVGN